MARRLACPMTGDDDRDEGLASTRMLGTAFVLALLMLATAALCVLMWLA